VADEVAAERAEPKAQVGLDTPRPLVLSERDRERWLGMVHQPTFETAQLLFDPPPLGLTQLEPLDAKSSAQAHRSVSSPN
jgi:hypothetical protein